MFEEARHAMPAHDSARLRAMRRQCKLNHPHGSEQGGCPCQYPSQCRFSEIALERLEVIAATKEIV